MVAGVSPATWVYLGTHRAGPGTGLSRTRFDPETGVLERPVLAAEASDPAYFVLHPDGRHLYTCNSGTPGGVSAYRLDPPTGRLTFLNRHVCTGRGPSHLSLDARGHFVLTANYGGGYVEVIALAADGGLGAPTAVVQHHGRSVDPERQARPHAHCIRVDPANRYALVADLGLDQVLVYRFDADAGQLAPHDPPSASTPAGAGPRHLAWHPHAPWLYVVDELAGAVTMFTWDAIDGILERGATTSMLPPDFDGTNASAEILVHPTGRTLYVSNRGHDSVAVCDLDPHTGAVTVREIVSAHGRTPRYMALDTTARWLLVTNHDSDNVTIFEVDEVSGRLAFCREVSAPRPYGIAVAGAV
jgi:6-phosphogluconolactonase